MKKHIVQLVLASILIVTTFVSMSQSYEIRTYENDMGYIEVQMRETDGGEALPETTDDINDITFAVRWLSSYSADIEFLCATQLYNMFDPGGSRLTEGSYHYRYYNASPSNFDCPEDWVVDTWVTITTFKVTSGSGTNGTFEIAPQNFGISTLNWQILENGVPPVNQYEPVINGNVSGYDYPTIVYNLVWTGDGNDSGFQNEHSWNLAANWSDECGGGGSTPTSSDNCIIPAGVTNYPENINQAYVVGTGVANNVRIQSSGSISFGIQGNQGELLNISGKLDVYGTFTINPDGGVTVGGNTYLDAATCLVIAADANGVGSFIDNGTITYGGSGTAKVQTYLTNAATVGNFYIHQVGPTVNTIAGGGNGAVANDFTISGVQTYAYEWDEPSDQWVNIFEDNPVPAGSGIIISTIDGANHILEMSGTLSTGNVNLAVTTGGSNNELLSNPYPSAVDFDALAFSNSGVINNKYWIWDPGVGTYAVRAGGSGGAQYVQVGQAFFVETVANGTFSFINTERAHSNDPFREVIANVLEVTAHGGGTSYLDRTYIRFDEDGTSGYDVNLEAIHWNSMYEDATQLSSVTEDDSTLAINVLPALDITTMVSVPVKFTCGYNGEYILSADGIESFEQEVEIWLKDKQNSNNWVDFGNNTDYYFTASPGDNEDRFVIHFFGPTSVSNYNVDDITMYSSGKYAYIINNSNEQIEQIAIFDLNGRKVIDVVVSEQLSYRQYVSDKIGYYVVRVITNRNAYTKKIFIKK